MEQVASNDSWQVHYRVGNQERSVTGRQVISTIPLVSLMNMLPLIDVTPPLLNDQLAYRSLICVFLAADGPSISDDTWTYFPDRDLVMGRTHEPPNWSPQMAPPGKTSLCAEVFCTAGDQLWGTPDDELISAVVTDLDGLSFLARKRVHNAWLVRVPNAYPVFRVGYADVLERLRDYLTRWPTLHLAGRTGSFQYLNMDGVIEQVLSLVNKLVPLV